MGRLSQAILAFTTTPCDGEESADVANLMPLVKAVIGSGFDLRFVIADNVYINKKLVEGVAGVGARLVGPLKPRNYDSRSKVNSGVRPVWEFAIAEPELYDELVRARQPIEGLFSLMKRERGRIASIGTAEERALEKSAKHDGLFVSKMNEMWIKVVMRNLLRIVLEERLRDHRISFAKGSVFSRTRERVGEKAA